MKKALLFSLQISLCTSTIICYFFPAKSLAQVTTDGTVNTVVSPNGNVAEITGGETRGSSLFHSFQDFSVGTGNEAFFNNANDISNIFSRVTGGNISNIDGTIRANGDASLFLINPAGILFGANARLDIGGSFYGSSASSILFEGGEFSAADLENPPLLTVNAPIGLGFRDNPAEITNSSIADDLGLQVLPGQKINLLGGDLNLTGGKITAPVGVINLGGLSTAGTITIEPDGNLSFPENLAKANVFLTDNAVVDITSNGGGLITVNADNLSLTEGSLFLAGIGEGLGSEDAVAGTIQINATRIFADNGSQIRADNSGIGQAGTVNINTDTLDFDDNSAIVVSTFGQGDAGTVNITAQNVSFEQEWGGIYSTVGLSRIATDDPVARAVGNGGEININTDTLALADGARISVNSVAQGDGGNINISATGEVLFSGLGDTPVPAFGGGMVISGASSRVEFEGVGNSGQINIEAGSLNLDTGAVLVDNKGIEGDAGDITLNIQNNISLDQGALIFAQVFEGAVGNGGTINIAANSYESKGGSFVLADNQGIGDGGNVNIEIEETISLDEGSRILTELGENAVGNAGDITITTNSLNLNSSSNIVAQTEGQGDAGEISITANEAISLDQSQISSLVNSSATGNGANISLTSGELDLTNQSRIIANIDGQSASLDDISTAGNINLDIAGNINLDNSQIQSQVGEDAVGNAGNITIETGDSLISTNGSQILTNSEGNGIGGDIQIIAGDSIELRDTSLIFANTSGQSIGNAGSVTLKAGNTFSISESLVLSQIQDQAEGNAGDIDITANTIDISNFSLVSSSTRNEALGEAGNINFNGANISINSGGIVAALTENDSNGGNIGISGSNLEIVSGGAVITSANNAGNAGSIILDITDDIKIDGEVTISRPEDVFSLVEAELVDLQESTGLFANTTNITDSIGNAGSIQINTTNLNIANNGTITVDSLGMGNGGNVEIKSESLELDNKASISSTAFSGRGGNANIQIADNLILRNNSKITVGAFSDAIGGNVAIDAGFIIAFPSKVPFDGNDIIAQAQTFSGGNISINTTAIFGMKIKGAVPGNGTNDISAANESSSIDLTPQFNVDLQNVPQIILSEQTSEQVCQSNRERTARNSFSINGKGGIPPAPDLPLDSHNISINSKYSNLTSSIPQAIQTSQGKIKPARGIKVNKDGGIILTAYRTNNAGDRLPEKRNCNQI